MGNDGNAMGSGTVQLLWDNRQHNWQRMIAANAEAAQLEATQDGQQQQS
jgi:hypothetical protein